MRLTSGGRDAVDVPIHSRYARQRTQSFYFPQSGRSKIFHNFTFVYKYMSLCIYIYHINQPIIYEYICIYIITTYLLMYICIYKCTCIHTFHNHISVNEFMYVCIYVHLCICIYVYMCI